MNFFSTLIFFLFSFLILLNPKQSWSSVWDHHQEWDSNWEQKYSSWVQQSWHKEMFSLRTLADGKPNPYFGLRMDCADTVYVMRAVFAYENGLPFITVDPTAPLSRISNKMSRWDHLNPEQRFKPFMVYIFGLLSTRSLPFDTYPVSLNQGHVRPGQLILTTRQNHHAWTIKEILPVGIPWLIFNSRVGAGTSLVLQERRSWPNPHWVFEGNKSPSGHAGIRAFRLPEHLGLPPWEVPGYSEDQYQIPLVAWNKTAKERLAQELEAPEQELKRLLQVVCDGATSRVQVVQEALSYKQSNPGCLNFSQYDNFSTPNRDKRVYDDLLSLRQSFVEYLQNQKHHKEFSEPNHSLSLDPEFESFLGELFPQPFKSLAQEQAFLLALRSETTSLPPHRESLLTSSQESLTKLPSQQQEILQESLQEASQKASQETSSEALSETLLDPLLESDLRLTSKPVTNWKNSCSISYKEGVTMSLVEFKIRLFGGLLSNNPHDSLEHRWGEYSSWPGPLGKRCEQWNPWTPKLEDNEF
jgi:hypothetical protein